MLITKDEEALNASTACDVRSRQNKIRGGSSETDEKELIVKPHGVPAGSSVVAIATPVAKRPHARRNASAVGVCSGLSVGFKLDKLLTLILS